MSLESFLDERAARKKSDADEDSRLAFAWAAANADPVERLIAFDKWACMQLEKRLLWQCSDDAKAKRIFQCRVELEHMLTQLFSRGWLLDGPRLARHINAVLDAVGSAQRAGKVVDFWPYFKVSVSRYVGANAEDLQAESKRAGNVMAGLLGSLGVQRQGSIVELVAQRRSEIHEEKTLREKLAKKRASDRAHATSAQPELFPKK